MKMVGMKIVLAAMQARKDKFMFRPSESTMEDGPHESVNRGSSPKLEQYWFPASPQKTETRKNEKWEQARGPKIHFISVGQNSNHRWETTIKRDPHHRVTPETSQGPTPT